MTFQKSFKVKRSNRYFLTSAHPCSIYNLKELNKLNSKMYWLWPFVFERFTPISDHSRHTTRSRSLKGRYISIDSDRDDKSISNSSRGSRGGSRGGHHQNDRNLSSSDSLDIHHILLDNNMSDLEYVTQESYENTTTNSNLLTGDFNLKERYWYHPKLCVLA